MTESDIDVLDKKLNDLISSKLNTALAPIMEKLDALAPKEADAETPKLDSEKLAMDLLKDKLKNVLPQDKLDSFSLAELQMADVLQKEIGTKGALNPIEENKDKMDAVQDMWGVHFERGDK